MLRLSGIENKGISNRDREIRNAESDGSQRERNCRATGNFNLSCLSSRTTVLAQGISEDEKPQLGQRKAHSPPKQLHTTHSRES